MDTIRKSALITDFEKPRMSKSGSSKVHCVPRSILNVIRSANEAIFNSCQTGCKWKMMQASNFDDVEAVLNKMV